MKKVDTSQLIVPEWMRVEETVTPTWREAFVEAVGLIGIIGVAYLLFIVGAVIVGF